MFQASRILAGIGIGILVTVCPMYMGELAPHDKRGWLVGHHAIFLVFGYMLSGWLGYACYFATASMPDFATNGISGPTALNQSSVATGQQQRANVSRSH